MTALAPPARDDRTSGFRSHTDSEPVRLLAPAPVRLKRSLHFSITSNKTRRSRSMHALHRFRGAQSETRNPTAPRTHCQRRPVSKKSHPFEIFSWPCYDPMLVYVPRPVDKDGTNFSNGDGVPRMAFFPHLLKKLWITPFFRSVRGGPRTTWFGLINLLFSIA